MIRKLAGLTALILLSICTGCAYLQQNNISTPADSVRPDTPGLSMKQWSWVRTVYSNDTIAVPAKPGSFTLTFKDDGTVHAATDCNRMFGNYSVDGRKLSFSKLAATKMYCPDSQEQDFAKMLSQVTSFLFTPDSRLVLELKYDSGQMIFK